MRLHHKLILTVSLVSLAVLATGAAGLYIVDKIGEEMKAVLEEKVAVADASNEIASITGGAEKGLLYEYQMTEDLDRLDQIEKEMKRYHRIDDMWLRAITYGTESPEFKNVECWHWMKHGYGEGRIVIKKAGPQLLPIIEELSVNHEKFHETAERLMVVHREMVVLQKRIEDAYSEDTAQRRRMRDIVHMQEDHNLMNDMWGVDYEGKEALYQYRDKEHVDEWIEAVETLQANVANSNLTPKIKNDLQNYSAEYLSLVRTISKDLLRLNERDVEMRTQMELVKGHITNIDANVAEIKTISFAARAGTKTEMQRYIDDIHTFLAVIIALDIALIFSVGYIISMSVTKSINRLKDATKKTGSGDFDVRVDVDRGDEIGELGAVFNEMAEALKKQTMALKKTQKDLEDQTIKLAENVKELEHSNQLKDLFTDIMRHDLLNPVGIIRNLAEILEEDEAFKDSEDFHVIWSNARKLEEMIQAASLYAKLESVEDIKWKEIDLNAIIKDAADSLKPYFDGKHIELKYIPEGKYIAKTVPIVEEVFVNLLSNAVKYSPENTEVTVDIGDAGENWKVAVADQGMGVPDEYKELIFDRFERKDKSGVRGAGLGLAIVKRIVELHGGRAWVEDNPQGGSIFYVEIPKAGS